MGNGVLIASADVFPAGTEVGAYVMHEGAGVATGEEPGGKPVATATMGEDGRLEFKGLEARTRYFAYACVDKQHRYVQFWGSDPSPPAATPHASERGPSAKSERSSSSGTPERGSGARTTK